MRKPSLEGLHHDLDETQGIVNILERARQELSILIDWDEGLRKNPLRHRQLGLHRRAARDRARQTDVDSANDRKAGIAAVSAGASAAKPHSHSHTSANFPTGN